MQQPGQNKTMKRTNKPKGGSVFFFWQSPDSKVDLQVTI